MDATTPSCPEQHPRKGKQSKFVHDLQRNLAFIFTSIFSFMKYSPRSE
jgi:hypothetical protein